MEINPKLVDMLEEVSAMCRGALCDKCKFFMVDKDNMDRATWKNKTCCLSLHPEMWYLKGLREIQQSKTWMCFKCRKKVEPVNVTYEETHVGCGGECY